MANEVSEKYRLLACEFAAKEGVANKLEEQKKIVFAELVNHYRETESAISAAEYRARADQRFKDLVQEMIAARTDANVAKADVKAMEIGFEYWRTTEASRRQEMKM